MHILYNRILVRRLEEILRERVADAEARVPRRAATRQEHRLASVHPVDRSERDARHANVNVRWRPGGGRRGHVLGRHEAGVRDVLEPTAQQEAEALAIQRAHAH